MKKNVDYDSLAFAREEHLKLNALRQAVRNMQTTIRSTRLDTITAYRAAGFTNAEIREIMRTAL